MENFLKSESNRVIWDIRLYSLQIMDVVLVNGKPSLFELAYSKMHDQGGEMVSAPSILMDDIAVLDSCVERLEGEVSSIRKYLVENSISIASNDDSNQSEDRHSRLISYTAGDDCSNEYTSFCNSIIRADTAIRSIGISVGAGTRNQQEAVKGEQAVVVILKLIRQRLQDIKSV